MRKKRRSKGEIIIDLTSLLDVIFIILLVVLCGQQVNNKNLNDEQKKVENENKQAAEQKELYEDMISTEDDLHKLVWAASISVPYDKNEITKREIKVLVEGEEIESFALVGNNVDESIEDFRSTLVNYIESHQKEPVILSLNENDDSILYRDEKRIREIINELMSSNNNVYIKGNLSEE